MPTSALSHNLRLAVVTDAVHPWNVGGKEMRQHELWSRLADSELDVDVYTMAWWGDASQRTIGATRFHAICRHVPLYSSGRRSFRQAICFAFATFKLLTVSCDVIEADVVPFLHIWPLWIVAKLKRRPLIITWHEYWGFAYWRQYLGAPGVVAGAVEWLTAHLATANVAASRMTAKRLGEVKGARRVVIVENGVDVKSLDSVRRSVTAKRDEFIVVGRLLRHKNVDLVIEALFLLREQGLKATLRIVGEGPEQDNLIRLVHDHGLDNCVEFTSWLEDRTTLLRAVATARVLVFPSSREGFGLVAIEALVLGTPVVTSRDPDNAAQLLVAEGFDGYLFQGGATALAEAMTKAWTLECPVGGSDTRATYDWDVKAALLVDLLRGLGLYGSPALKELS